MEVPSALSDPSAITAMSGISAMSDITLIPGTTAPAGPAALTNTYSLDTNGTNQYSSLSVPLTAIFQSDHTLLALVKFDALAGVQYIMGANNTSYYDRVVLFKNATNHIGGFYKADNIQTTSITKTSGMTLTDWNLVAFITKQNGANVETELVFNGVSAGTSSDACVMADYGATYTPEELYINAQNEIGTASAFLNGKTDEVAIFDSALTVAQILTIYNSGDFYDITSLSPHLWHRQGDDDGGTGSTVTDQGSGGNDGTLINSPSFVEDVT